LYYYITPQKFVNSQKILTKYWQTGSFMV